jgi:predicted AlkP superfamily phosphohydrolase/phosphomutase
VSRRDRKDLVMKRVIVIGLDGLEPKIVESMLAAGELPNLQRLRAQGGYGRVATTSPAETPVAWSTFATGTNPGGHGIFDFIRRDPATYLPDLALNRYEQKNALSPPRAVNLRRGTPVWDVLSAAGVAATVLRCPCTYPPDPVRGRMLSGMGVPDLRGGLGTATFYTSAEGAAPRESENVVRVAAEGATIATHLIGPRHPRTREDVRLDLTIRVDRAGRRVVIHAPGAPQELEVRQGKWSDWLRVKFKTGLFQTVRGLVRFHLVALDPAFELYASPINFDPELPLFPISTPADYAAELAGRFGPFHTTGMVEDHAGLSNERFGEEAFLDQCATAWEERADMMVHELERFDQGLFYCLFDTPDRVQHLFWRFREPEHPANRGRPTRPDLARAVEDQYRRGDTVVGAALGSADHETLVIVLSDHGFGSFQRGIHLNSWLRDQGLLTLRDDAGPGGGDLLRGIDWSRTRAYALGLGGIYLNLEGREADGIVKADESDALAAEIAGALGGLGDPERGRVAINRVLPRAALYHGPYTSEAPDLLVHCAPGYRVSWESSLGGVPDGLFADNVKKWGGDHIIDPALIPGVLFLNRPFRTEGASLIDLAPTILGSLGVPAGPAMEGSSLLS